MTAESKRSLYNNVRWYIPSGDETTKSKRRTAGIQRVSDHQQDSRHGVAYLEQFSGDNSEATSSNHEPIIKSEAHSHESKQQETFILSARARNV
jgi:hypothetical protein